MPPVTPDADTALDGAGAALTADAPAADTAKGSLLKAATSSATAGTGSAVDLVVSLAAGAEAWADDTDRSGPLALAEVLAIAVAVSWPAVLMASGVTPVTWRSVVLFAVMVMAAGVFVIPLLGEAGRQRYQRLPLTSSVVTSSALRVGCVVVAIVCGTALVPTAALVGTWPLGVAVGLDLARAAQSLGIRLEPAAFVWRSLRSAVHLGVLVGVVAVLIVDPFTIDRVRVLALYVTGLALIALGALTVGVANAEIRRWRARLDFHRRQVMAAEARSRGHWLHDDVCSEIRFTRLRLDSGIVAPDAVVTELDELDHRLRLRQLDEFIDAGSVRVAEVVQPFLRRVQQHGVVIEESPSLDTAGRSVPAEVARKLRRFLAVTIGNALQAGANRISVRVRWTAGDLEVLEVEVIDDAGGLPAGAVQPGTGLDALGIELGPGNLELGRGDAGLVARAMIQVPSTGPERSWVPS